jgi:hypothetical protein
LKQIIVDFLGIPADPTSLTAAAFTISAAGVVTFVAAPILAIAAPATPVANTLYTDSVVKGWVKTSGAGAWTIDDDLNVSSITDNAAGRFTINWATAFAASTSYSTVPTLVQDAAPSDRMFIVEESRAAGSIAYLVENGAGTDMDPDVGVSIIAIGDQ